MNQEFGHWFAGFFAGEGCFQIRRQRRPNSVGYSCAAGIELRRDDSPILVEIWQATGLGQVSLTEPRGKNSSAQPQVRWQVTSKQGCRDLARIFMQYPLRAKKGREFFVWTQALDAWETMPSRGGSHLSRAPFDYSKMARLYDELRALRQYRSPAAA